MKFGEKVKSIRENMGLTQVELAKRLDITARSVQNYEGKNNYPKKRDTLRQMAKLFGVTSDYLIDEEDAFMMQVKDKYGLHGKVQAQGILNATKAFLAGGEINDEDKDKFFQSFTKLYFEAKEINKKKFGKK